MSRASRCLLALWLALSMASLCGGVAFADAPGPATPTPAPNPAPAAVKLVGLAGAQQFVPLAALVFIALLALVFVLVLGYRLAMTQR